RTLKMSFWIWYDYMGTWFMINLCLLTPWIIFIVPLFLHINTFPPLLIGFLLFGACLYFYIANVFISAFTVSILEHKEGLKNKLGFAIKITFIKSLPIGLLFLFLFTVLLINIWFYLHKKFSGLLWVNYIFIGLFLWLILFTFCSLLWSIPTLSFKRLNTLKNILWGYIILIANPYFSFQLLFCYTISTLLNIFPLYFFFIGTVIPPIILTCAYEILSRKYEAIQKQQIELPEYIVFRDYEDEFLNRSWEHLFKPWKL
ncbi:MAG: hypothetical protein LDL53_00175, partial [Candidatus Hydrogenedens sp.]|nr:hypothetical protein [Candidatus Hydrogenedens sp.]